METQNYSYYEILEVDCHCDQNQIMSAYQRIKNTYSVDNPAVYTVFTEKETRELSLMIEEAYSVLSNKTLRSLYDKKIAKGNSSLKDLSFENLKAQSLIPIPETKIKPTAKKLDFKIDPNIEEEIKACQVWDGKQLKKIREYKGFTVEQVSETTKISAFYISAIEKMNLKELPALVFVRGYVLQIVRVLSLPNEKQAVDSYMALIKKTS